MIGRIFRKKREQTTFCYCPTCQHELCSCANCFVEDTDLVRYRCTQCGTRTEWLFDAPVPLLINTYPKEA